MGPTRDTLDRSPRSGDPVHATSPASDDDVFASHLLVVDDEPVNLALMQTVLERAGFAHVQTSAESSQVVSRCRFDPPDLILLDLHMPEVDGHQILAELDELRERDDFLPIVVLTADTTDRARDEALRLGATDFVTKPFDITDLVLRVRNLLRARVANQELRQTQTQLRDQVGALLHVDERAVARHREITERVVRVAHEEQMTILFQPIVDLESGRIVGAEALSRFPMLPLQPPDVWFAEAAEVGLGVQLELVAMRQALQESGPLPAGAFLSVNASPDTICCRHLVPLLERFADRDIVVELTEQRYAGDEADLGEAIERLRHTRRIRLAIDDAGAGYAGLSRILRLQPQMIKLDRFLIVGIDRDPVRQSMTSGLARLAVGLGADLVAEGIETIEELRMLRELGVRFGQGYLLEHPRPLPFDAGAIPVDRI